MAADSEPDLKLEIAHVLTLDVVAYSTLLIHEQSRIMAELTRIVRNAPRFRAAETEGKLTRLPTGDGMALVFFDDPEAPVECAMQISRELKPHPEILLRMGIHSGPVNQVLDVNDRSNVAGAGIDMAQRVMDCGDAGHILVSKRVAEDLAPYSRWNRHLHDLGECEVKHGRRISVFNFYTEGLGNPDPPRRMQAPSGIGQTGRERRGLLLLGGIGLAIACVTAFVFWSRPSSVEPIRRSVAVLPFVDLSQGKDQEYFSDGITEQIINSLGKIRGLLVVARSSSFVFKNKVEDVRVIGKRLSVTHLIEGSVNRSGGRVRIDTHLIDVGNGYQLWNETYDSTERDALSLQSDIAQKVASALQVELHLQESKQIAVLPTNNPEAYDLYLHGRFLMNKRTDESIKEGRHFFEEAVAKDPGFALGHAGIAAAYILLAEYGVLSAGDAASRAWPEVTSAIAINPNVAEAHASRGLLLAHYEWDWPGGEAAFRKAIELNPNSATAHHWFALHLAELGRFDEARREIEVAQERDPLALIIRAARAKILFVARDYAGAVEECEKTIKLDPDFAPAYSVMGLANAARGQFEDAIKASTKYGALSGDLEENLELAYVYAAAGKAAETEKIVRSALAAPDPFPPYEMATVCAASHDTAGALAWLKKALARRSLLTVWLRVDPRFNNIRSDPGFQKLIEQLKPRL